MANNTKTIKYGNYLCKVGNFDLYTKFSYGKPDGQGLRKATSHDICVYFAKRLVKSGFKTKQQATDYINTLPSTFRLEKNRK